MYRLDVNGTAAAHLSREGQDLARDAVGERLPGSPHGRHRRRAAHDDLQAQVAVCQPGLLLLRRRPTCQSAHGNANRVLIGERSAYVLEQGADASHAMTHHKAGSESDTGMLTTNLLAGADDGVAALGVGVHCGVRHAAHAVVVRDAVRGGLLSVSMLHSWRGVKQFSGRMYQTFGRNCLCAGICCSL